ncbi:sensor histidine kinase [Luteibacter sp. SG786]|uniref:sensor histidine kinase n=1 Tax=Luteibacter sp. SG786 TaxID=2587130 RepID=UPI00141F9868|nr:sensor histidine kinase [Luteibacter sp. SG786]NII54044.1 ligand-binding sensor domain-containing protein [Luteibacter sp. SG786]
MTLAIRIAVLAVCVLVLMPAIVLAQNDDQQLDGFTRTVFSQQDGAFGHISGMAQTPDGWIWLAERSHLYRFDGILPELVEIPTPDTSDIGTIFATNSGDLWLSFGSGRTIVLPAGDVHQARTVPKKDASELKRFQEDGLGRIWSFSYNAVYETTGDEWHQIGKGAGLDADHFYSILLDTDGTLWVLSNKGVFTLAEGRAKFESAKFSATWITPRANEADNHALRIYGNVYLSIVIAMAGKKEVPSFCGSRLRVLRDTRDGFWLMSSASGVRRASSPNPQDLFALGASLEKNISPAPSVWTKMSSSSAGGGFEDRQGNVWVVTRTGLELFRPNVAARLKLPRGDYAYSMLPDHDASIWFGTAQSVHPYRWWHVASTIKPARGYDLDTTAAYRDIDDSVLLGSGGGLLRRFNHGKFEPVSPQPPGSGQGDDVIAMARDGQGKLWVSILRRPIARLDKDGWLVKGGFDQLPDKGNRRAVTDARGRLWLSYPHEVFVLDGQHLTRYSRDEGMDITNVGDIIPDGMTLLGGADGLAAFDGRQFRRIFALDSSVLTNINGMTRLGDGSVWLYGQKGVVRIGAGEIEHALKNPQYRIAIRVFDDRDGVPGAAQNAYPNPSLVQGADGRLWLAGDNGLAWIDPEKLPAAREPKVVIRSIMVGSKSYRPDSALALAPGTRDIQIDYTALGLGDATRSRFRYQLIGVDKDWQDAGGRRQAFYTNLGPGSYHFRVEALNENNTWNETADTVRFAIEPKFHQTTWFFVLCAVVVIALLWVGYLYRLRQVTKGLMRRLEERHAERDRIARELHDTYLQTTHGLVLKMHAVSRELPDGNSKKRILSALELARAALAEGRGRVYALRAGPMKDLDLAVAFRAIAQEFAGDPVPNFIVSSSGTNRAVDPLVIDELYASGREAVINAFNHASANTVRVDLRYEKRGVRVEITDDGKGIELQVVEDKGISGHWGIRGMYERMDRVGGMCEIEGNTATGTKVTLFVPRRRAYRH